MSSLASSLSLRTNNYSFGHEDSNSLPGATYGVLDIKRKLFHKLTEVGCVTCFNWPKCPMHFYRSSCIVFWTVSD